MLSEMCYFTNDLFCICFIFVCDLFIYFPFFDESCLPQPKVSQFLSPFKACLVFTILHVLAYCILSLNFVFISLYLLQSKLIW